MAVLVPCNFAVHVGDFDCTCEGIARFRDEAPFVWYKANENAYCLVWNITIEPYVAEKIQVLVQGLKSENIFAGQPTSNLRSYVFDRVFQDNVKEPLIKMSTSNIVWDKLGMNNYNRYFSNGLGIAVRDIFGYGLSWRRDCENSMMP